MGWITTACEQITTPTSRKIKAFHEFHPHSIPTPKDPPDNASRSQGGPAWVAEDGTFRR